MKTILRHTLCLILIVAMLMQVCVFATDPNTEGTALDGVRTEEPTDPTDPTDPEDPADPEEPGIEIPAGWWHDALEFMVINGFMKGTSTGLNQTSTASRAETATMLTRIMGLMDNPGKEDVTGMDLSQYTDIGTWHWYHRYMSVAVRYGMFNGTSNTTLSPATTITREQVFAVIGRIFGYADGTAEDIASFTDADKVSYYAVPYVASLVKHGIVNGAWTNGQLLLNPQAQVSRAELAQVLYNLLSKQGMIYDGNSSLPAAGTVLWSCEENPADITIDGNLVLGGDAAEEVDLSNVTVTGNLVIAMRDNTRVNLTGCSVNKVILLSQTTVTNDAPVNGVEIKGAGGSAYFGDAGEVTASADTAYSGTCGKLSATCGDLTIGSGAQIQDLTVDCPGGVCTLDGTATNVELKNRQYTLQGSGYAENVTYHYTENEITCGVGNKIADLDARLEGTTIKMGSGYKVKPASPSTNITATFTNVNEGYGYGSNGRKCTLRWYVNGTLKQTATVYIKDGSTATYRYTCTDFYGSDATVKAVLECEGQTLEASTTVTVSKEVYIQNYPGYIAGGDYSEYEKEVFVNSMGYSSPTGYLIWVNRYHTKVNIFQGSRGNWNLIHTYSVGIGAQNTPTIGGQYRIAGKYPTSARWSYGSWYVDHIMMWGHGGYAFHTRARLTSNGNYFVNDVNAMVSHGCVRMNVPDVAWMHANLPVGTTIISY